MSIKKGGKKTLEVKDLKSITDKFYNCKPSKNLTSSKGLNIATFPKTEDGTSSYSLALDEAGLTAIKGITYFKQYSNSSHDTTHRILIHGNDNKIYINQMFDDDKYLYWLYSLSMTNPPVTLTFKQNDTDSVILASEDEMYVWKTDLAPYKIEDVPIITSMCMNNGILFCTIQDPAFKIWYCTDLDAENVGNVTSVSNYISLEDDLGYARMVVTLNENVYVFRDYGITKIDLIKKSVSINKVYASNTKIFANTIAVCGNLVLFMTKDGLYSFNGSKVVKLNLGLKVDARSVKNAVAYSLGNDYYLALKVDFNDTNSILCETNAFINNALLIYNFDSNVYEIIRGVDILNMLPIKTDTFEKMYVIFNSVDTDKIAEVCDENVYFASNLPIEWTSNLIFNEQNLKQFTKLIVDANSGVNITLDLDGEEKTFVTYQNGINEFRFKNLARNVKIKFTSSTALNVDDIKIEYYDY